MIKRLRHLSVLGVEIPYPAMITRRLNALGARDISCREDLITEHRRKVLSSALKTHSKMKGR